MDFLTWINNVLKYLLLSFSSLYIIFKIINFQKFKFKNIIAIVIVNIIMSIACALFDIIIPSIISVSILIFSTGLILLYLVNTNFSCSLIITMIAYTISYILYVISFLITCMITELSFIQIPFTSPLIIVIASLIDFICIYKLFSISRFKNGFSFLKSDNKIFRYGHVIFLLYFITVTLFTVFGMIEIDLISEIIILLMLLIYIGTFIWIKRNITLDYQDRMKNRKIENLQKELEEKDRINHELTEEIKNLTIINHKYNSRIKAAKEEISRLAFAIKHNSNTEFSSEISEVTKLIDDLSNEYSNKINDVLKYSKPLPKTNVKGVDTILEHMKLEAAKNNIDFDLKVNCSVRDFTDKYISISDLETLIGDHIKDAIIAINHSDKSIRNITVIFDIINNCYRFSVYDSGIDFEIDTLVNLGLEATTTHKDEGGTGIGFMTTFETLKKYNASLVIDEINFNNSNFSKSINIVFDGKHEYVVCSSRTEEIKKKDKANRIILNEKKL